MSLSITIQTSSALSLVQNPHIFSILYQCTWEVYLTKYHYFSIHIYSQFYINVHKKCTWPSIIFSISTYILNFASMYIRSVLDQVSLFQYPFLNFVSMYIRSVLDQESLFEYQHYILNFVSMYIRSGIDQVCIIAIGSHVDF